MIQELAEGTAVKRRRPVLAARRRGPPLRRDQDVIICLWPDDLRVAALPPAPDYGRGRRFHRASPGRPGCSAGRPYAVCH
ncbi:MAG: hypothetical protein R2854_04725 [Caldilineaceae bacterium]